MVHPYSSIDIYGYIIMCVYINKDGDTYCWFLKGGGDDSCNCCLQKEKKKQFNTSNLRSLNNWEIIYIYIYIYIYIRLMSRDDVFRIIHRENI